MDKERTLEENIITREFVLNKKLLFKEIEEKVERFISETLPGRYLLKFHNKEDVFDTIIFINDKNYLIQRFKKDLKIDYTDKAILELLFDLFAEHSFNEGFINEVVKLLIKDNITITTMESCTSGMVANLITNTEGASSIMQGAFVTYSNSAKVMQGVSSDTIDNFGVYSSETAFEMAMNCREKFNTNIGIGVTGTTGNTDPNNADSKQGEIYYSFCTDKGFADCKLKIDTTNLSRKQIKEIICGNIFRTLNIIL